MRKTIKLKSKYSTLCNRNVYTIPLDSCINTVREYDIKRANISMFKEYNILSKSQLNKIDKLADMERKIYIGVLKKNDKKLSKIEKSGIISSKNDLFRENNIQDEDVLSIKNDAVFIIGRKLLHTKITDNIEFVLKNTYTSFHRINNIEFYFNNKTKVLHCKGISDTLADTHREGIVGFLIKVFMFVEKDRRDDLRKFIVRFSNEYKERKLPKEYYKEFNNHNCYRINGIGDNCLLLDNISTTEITDLNITYNYIAYVLPIIQRYL